MGQGLGVSLQEEPCSNPVSSTPAQQQQQQQHSSSCPATPVHTNSLLDLKVARHQAVILGWVRMLVRSNRPLVTPLSLLSRQVPAPLLPLQLLLPQLVVVLLLPLVVQRQTTAAVAAGVWEAAGATAREGAVQRRARSRPLRHQLRL